MLELWDALRHPQLLVIADRYPTSSVLLVVEGPYSMNRRWLRQCWALVVLSFLVSGCQTPFRPPLQGGATTLEGAARQTVVCGNPPDDGVGFLVRATYPWAQGWIAIYDVSCPAQADGPVGRHAVQGLGHTFVEQLDGRWYAHASNWSGRRAAPNPEEVIDIGFNRGGGSDPASNYSIVYGRALIPEVAAVEVTFANGVTQQARPHNTIFAVILPGAVMACELRALAADGTVLRSQDLQPVQPCTM